MHRPLTKLGVDKVYSFVLSVQTFSFEFSLGSETVKFLCMRFFQTTRLAVWLGASGHKSEASVWDKGSWIHVDTEKGAPAGYYRNISPLPTILK